MKKILLITSILVLSAVFLSGTSRAAQYKNVSIIRGPKKIVTVKAEVADTLARQAAGLMFRRSLPEKQGMWFVFKEDVNNPFWMKNTYISLDIMFIDKNRKIIDIKKKTEPLSETPLYPSSNFRYVLEVNAGFTTRYGIKNGDRVIVD